MPDVETVRPHPALGKRVVRLQELFLPEDAPCFRELAESSQPCVLRGLAAHWPVVERGRFDAATKAELRRCMSSRLCHVSFEPSSTLFGFEVPDGWTAPTPEEPPAENVAKLAPATSAEEVRKDVDVPRLVNPGRIAMPFASFLDVCDRKCNGGGASGCTARVVNVPYEEEEEEAAEPATSQVEAPLDVPLEELERLALYCVEDAATWPEDLFRSLVPEDPAEALLPEWVPLLRERRVWMSAGGPEGVAHITAGFHWDHMQNIHVLLSGRKEVFLVPPLEAAALHATRFCPQAQWRLEPGKWLELAALRSEESSSDYAVVGADQAFAVNALRCPALRELRQAPRWAVLSPGDAVYIPSGWWHSVRTWRPRRTERGLPFSLSANFWYAPTQQAARAGQPELFTLQVLSCQRAMAGSPQAHLDTFLQRLEAQANRLEEPGFAAVD